MSHRNSLLRARQFFSPERSADGWSEVSARPREWEQGYRNRWQHDRVVRSTHGVNCTGSCSWKIHVKDGLVTWETQFTDYPSNGAETPDYEPRGCPRGASFSWYVYSPLRPKFPYVRGELLGMFREARQRLGDPVDAWESIVEDPEKARAYKSRRGKGGFLRSSWAEVTELAAAAHVYTVRKYGPDRIAGFSPIPAMSQVSYAAGTRFLSLIGGVPLSFYDWYADLPPASPQVWGDQTDVPESADWWDASYLIMWGSNIPQTRTPDAHFMTEARYRGQKVIVVSPDYAGNTKFADQWLPAVAGSDGALAMAMGHVILKEFFVDREAEYFGEYARQFTDLPFLVELEDHGDGTVRGGAMLRATELGDENENAEWKTVLIDAKTGEPVVPNGSIGDRWGEQGEGRWNLDLEGIEPALTLLGSHDELVEVTLPRFDGGETEGGVAMVRGVPARRVGGKLVTTVFDLALAQYGVHREGLPGTWPAGYDDPAEPYTPAWQEEHTGVEPALVIQVAREFAQNAEKTRGRSMIIMGAGTNHWYHADQTYRAKLAMLLFCGCQGVNGGGWAHYVGQEKVRPITGWSTLAFALDWNRPPRHQAATPFWYLATDQWRYETRRADEFASPAGPGGFDLKHIVDANAQAVRLGWTPSAPALDRNPLDLADEARDAGKEPAEHVVDELKAGRLGFACEDPDNPANFPRVLTLWRANLLGSSSKGHEYFLKHLLGTDSAVRSPESDPDHRPEDVKWREEAPEGKADLFMTIDFRMNGSCLYSDIVLPAATWYEKHDISSTDLHPFVHPFNAAIPPPWEAKTDWDAFNLIARKFSELAEKHLGTRTDIVTAPLLHDTPEELAQPGGLVRDWRKGECEPIPGKTMPKLIAVERDFTAVGEKMNALGPLVEKLGVGAKGVSWKPAIEVEELRRQNGTVREGAGAGRPAIETDIDAAEVILALSGTTNGRIAVESFRELEPQTGRKLTTIVEEHADEKITFRDLRVQPRKVHASAEWSGSESRERRYSPFTTNIEHLIPFRTLTGRQSFYVDHQWMLQMGEGLPAYRPPVRSGQVARLGGVPHPGDALEVTVRFLTPHSKWSIHSEFQDNLHMLTLFRGGPAMWISETDAERVGVEDNDWLEVYNSHGAVSCRAAVSRRVPDGVALFYHSQDRHVNVPISEVTGHRGGTDNSLTRISMKPTHMIGGYAQLSYGFNYYGPCGTQRDQLILIRKRQEEVRYQ